MATQECNPKCSCAVKDLSTDCSLYTGENLPCSGIEKNTILSTVIKKIDEFICNKFNEAIAYLTLKNVGLGAKIFKGINSIGEKEIKSITTSNLNILEIEEGIDEINLKPANLTIEFDEVNSTLTLKALNSAGETILSTASIPLPSGDDLINSLVSVSYNPVTYLLTFIKEDATNTIIDLSNLNNKLESGVYDSVNNKFIFTLTDTSTVDVNIQTLIDEIISSITIPELVQSDFTESDNLNPAFIKNKNPTKTVVLEQGGNYDVLDSDNNFIIEIDNDTNNATINLSTITKTSDFFVGFIQKGTGTITINNFTIKPQGLANVIFGQGHVIGVEVVAGTKYLFGNLKVV